MKCDEQGEPQAPDAEAPAVDEGDDATRQEGEASSSPTEGSDGEHHVEAAGFTWEPIETADKEGLVMVWDGAFLSYPIAAAWYREPIKQPVYTSVRARKLREAKGYQITGYRPGYWRPVEEDLMRAAESVGGLKPTHWLKWKPPSEPTYSAWDEA